MTSSLGQRGDYFGKSRRVKCDFILGLGDGTGSFGDRPEPRLEGEESEETVREEVGVPERRSLKKG